MRLRLVALLLLCGAAPANDELVKARHAQLVLGDIPAAIALYQKALQDKSLTPAEQAEAHLGLAICFHDSERPERAKGHLAKGIYDEDSVPAAVRVRATELRLQIEAAEPKPTTPEPARVDASAQRARRLREHIERAQRCLRDNAVARASYHVQAALEIAPDDASVKALEAEVETRLSGVMEFLQAPLRFVSRWTASRTRAVAKEAEVLLRKALTQSQLALAEPLFRDAIEHIDACEFAAESDELIELRALIRERWRNMRRKVHGEEGADPVLPKRTAGVSLLTEYLNHLQRMLDSVSSAEREYRIVPVTARRAAKRARARVVPRRYALYDHLPSTWTPALFASLYLPRRIHPLTWSEPGNYLDAAGGVLIMRNRTQVLDDLHRAVRRIESGGATDFLGRFLLVSAPSETIERLGRQFGTFSVSKRGESPLQYRVVDARYSLEFICSQLRDEGADVNTDRDTFEVTLDNGVAQSLFVAAPRAPKDSTHHGVHIDAFPFREVDGRTALALRLTARHPAPRPGTLQHRFLSQQGELFADVDPGSTLIVAGLLDPFAAGTEQEGRELLLLWENGGKQSTVTERRGRGVEISLRNLLLTVRDHPGPRADPKAGFVRVDRLDVHRERAAFLQALLRTELRDEAIEVDAEEAVVRVPPALRDEAAALITQIEEEGRRSYVVRVMARAVRTNVFERWMRTESVRPVPFGAAQVVTREGTVASVLHSLRGQQDDVFAPDSVWPAVTALGLQAAHALHARTRTSPTYVTDDDLATADTRTVTEGTRVTVRPYTRGNQLRAWIEVELAGLESEVEELSLRRAVPSYRTRIGRTTAGGWIDLGLARDPRTAVICRIPHPTASTLETLTEIVIAVSVRPIR